MQVRPIFNALLRYAYYYPSFWSGYVLFRLTGHTPRGAYRSMRRLYSATGGGFNRNVSRWLARGVQPTVLEAESGLLGSATKLEGAIDRALADLRRDGFHVFERRMPTAQVEALVRFARGTEALLLPRPAGGPECARFDPDNAVAPRYLLDEEEVASNEAAQCFMADQTMMMVAERYLEAPPINDLVGMWWSAPADPATRSAAAQLYHFDQDRLRFIKFFVYLTDVGSHNGPHVVVRGSHRTRPRVFYSDRRFRDEEVAAAFPADDVRELVGPAGTILAVDTSALHKGKPLESGHRLILELEYANSLFGQSYNRIQVRAQTDGPMAHALEHCPRVLQRFAGSQILEGVT